MKWLNHLQKLLNQERIIMYNTHAIKGEYSVIKYVEHTIYGGNNNEFDLSPNEISYGFFNYGIFAGQFSINLNLFGGKTNTGLNVNLGFEDQ